jgi:hypothetical protein
VENGGRVEAGTGLELMAVGQPHRVGQRHLKHKLARGGLGGGWRG